MAVNFGCVCRSSYFSVVHASIPGPQIAVRLVDSRAIQVQKQAVIKGALPQVLDAAARVEAVGDRHACGKAHLVARLAHVLGHKIASG